MKASSPRTLPRPVRAGACMSWGLVSICAAFLLAAPLIVSGAATANYLQTTSPNSPWKSPARVPTEAEVSNYAERLVGLQSLSGEGNNVKTFSDEIAKKLAEALEVPSLIFGKDEKAPEKPLKKMGVLEFITTSPVLPSYDQIAPAPARAASQEPSTTPSAAAAPPPASNLLRRPVTGGASDIYIPFSFTPGSNPPPIPSAVIYQQPE
ncbi:MAG: hypothetical protein HY360_03675 [Verrucomicrobia bacterium]|nr:hypothetical protein [Verrucomicrobiota bacterium]